MAQLIWSSKYATGFSEVDEQHRRLFDFINQIEYFIKDDVYEGYDVDILFELINEYTKMHFALEEECMKKVKCPAAQKNEKAHKEFSSFFQEFLGDYSAADKIKKKELLCKLQNVAENWILSHIAKIDIHLRACAIPKNK